MNELPLIVVLGATSSQGGAVVESLLSSREYRIRGVTRNITSEKSHNFASRGVEMVSGDVSHMESLRMHFYGAWTVFAVSNYFDTADFAIGRNLLDMCQENKVEYFIGSTVPPPEDSSRGKWHVPTFSDKAKIESYIKGTSVKAIFLSAAFYYQNFAVFFPPKRDEQNVIFTVPFPENSFLTSVDINEIGTAVTSVLKKPEKYVGKLTPVWGMHAPLSEYLKQFSKATGKKTKYAETDHMFGYFEELELVGDDDLDRHLQKKINPHATSFEEWIRTSGWNLS